MIAAETLYDYLKGVDVVFLVLIASTAAVSSALERILKHTARIVFLSSPYKTPHPFFQAAQPNVISTMHTEIERLVEASGREWTFLRPGMFSLNALGWWASQIRSGAEVIRWPY